MSAARRRDTILHLSDVHATRGELLYGQVDGLARLDEVGDYVVAAGLTPEAVVVTGDLIERGHADAYPELAQALARLGSRVRAPVLTILGNHDEPGPAAALPGHDGHAGRHHRTAHVGGLRLVLLDSSRGALGPDQLAWLREELREPFGRGTVLALHHPPVPSPLPALARACLADAADLAGVLAGSDVRLVLAGHYHHAMSATFAGVPVAVGPSLAYQQVMNAGPGRVSGYDRPMFSLVHVTDDAITCAPVPIGAPVPLFSQPVPLPAS